MLTKKQIQRCEKYLRLSSEFDTPTVLKTIEVCIREIRELQAENARLREQLTKTGEKNAVRN